MPSGAAVRIPAMTFQERLQAAIARANATPKTLASALGVSVQAVGQVLSGSTRALTAENCVRAALFLGVRTEWLAAGLGDMALEKAEQEMSLSPQERDLIVALRVLPETERLAIIASVMQQARSQLDHLSALIERNPPSPGTVIPLRR
jgi:transcriptional regulator with XRE-family HTH domain